MGKIWIVTAICLLAIGLVIFTAVMASYHWDFTKLSTGQYETNTYALTTDFHSITIGTDTADIRFAVSDDDSCKVVCYETEKIHHSVNVQADTLCIRKVDERKWYEYIGIHFKTPQITVYMPKGAYRSLAVTSSTGALTIPADFQFTAVDVTNSTGNITCFASATEHVNIQTNTGNIRVENISTGMLALSVSTGKITASGITCTGDMQLKVSTGKTALKDIRCKNFSSQGNTGDISLQDLIAEESISIIRSTGDVQLNSCDGATLSIRTDTGDVKGTLLSEKVFITKTDTGSIDVPKTVTGGKCEITTDTGDIRMELVP